MMAIANRVLDICTSAASNPIKNCSTSSDHNFRPKIPPESNIHPASTASQAAKEKVSTGLLPSRSRREPRNHKLLSPPRNAVEVTSRIFPSDIPTSVLRKATVKAVIPPYAIDQPTTVRNSFAKGGWRIIESHGTLVFEVLAGSGDSASGI